LVGGRDVRVLVCDDDPDVGPMVRMTFETRGCLADLVMSGEECLRHLDSADPAPDVLVLDQMMPGMTGIEVAEALRSSGSVMPIVLCSAYLGPHLAADIARLGLFPVNKIDVDALFRITRESVRAARAAG
jgi:CheY-like chemotaxis protein